MIIIQADLGHERDRSGWLRLTLWADGSSTGEAPMMVFASFGKIFPCL
jgi:hypothetical protein